MLQHVLPRVSGFPVASLCLCGKLQNLSCFKVSKQVTTWFCVACVPLREILTCLQKTSKGRAHLLPSSRSQATSSFAKTLLPQILCVWSKPLRPHVSDPVGECSSLTLWLWRRPGVLADCVETDMTAEGDGGATMFKGWIRWTVAARRTCCALRPSSKRCHPPGKQSWQPCKQICPRCSWWAHVQTNLEHQVLYPDWPHPLPTMFPQYPPITIHNMVCLFYIPIFIPSNMICL